jgi:iron complex outermembrane receptor protein
LLNFKNVQRTTAVTAVTILFSIPQYAAAQLEEIVVTTRKKQENLQQLPIAVNAITAEQIDRQGIANLFDVAKMDPSVQFGTGFGPQDTRVTLRGLSNTRGRSNVAILVDGVDVTTENFISPGSGLLANQRLLNDVERIEIIKGPQSALYGRSAFAGAISYVTKEPGDELGGRVRLDAAEDGFMQLDGSVGGPIPGIEDQLGMRLSGVYWTDDGHYKNSISDDPVGGGDGYGAAWTTVFTPTESINIKARVEYSDDKYNARPVVRIGGGLTGANLKLTPYPEEALTSIDPETGLPVLGAGSDLFTGLLDFVQYCPELQPWFDGTTSGDENGDGFFDDEILHDPAAISVDENGAVLGSGFCMPTTFGQASDHGRVTHSENPANGNDWKGFDTTLLRATLTANFDMSFGTFSSITGFTDFDSTDEYDQDAQALGRPDQLLADFHSQGETETKQFSQELRFASSFDGPVNFTLGGNYWNETRDLRDENYIVSCIQLGKNSSAPWGDPARIAMGIEGVCDGNQGTVTSWQENWQDLHPCRYDGTINDAGFYVPVMDPATGTCMQEPFTKIPWGAETDHWSIYASLEWAITDKFTLTLENRYVDEDFEIARPNKTSCSTIGAPFGTVPFIQIFEEGIVSDARDDIVCVAEQVFNDAIPVPPTEDYAIISGSESSKFNTPKVTLDFTPTDDSLVYFSWAHAQKPGGINAASGSNTATTIDDERFAPEKMDAWEIGTKTSWEVAGYLQLNGALFFNDYTDKQIGTQKLVEDSDGVLTLSPRTVNASAAEVWGLELDATWQPGFLDGLTLSAAYTYLDAKYTDYVDNTRSLVRAAKAGNCTVTYIDEDDNVVPPSVDAEPFCRVDLSGKNLEGSAENSFVGNLQLTRPFLQTGNYWFFELNALYQDERFFTQDNFLTLDEYWLLDTRIGLTSDNWEFLIYVNNLLDDDTLKQGARGPDFGDQVTKLGFTAGLGATNWFSSLPDPRIIGARITYQF